METGKIEFNPMNEYTYKRDFIDAMQKIPKRLDRLIELLEEQNLLIGTEDELIECCPDSCPDCGLIFGKKDD